MGAGTASGNEDEIEIDTRPRANREPKEQDPPGRSPHDGALPGPFREEQRTSGRDDAPVTRHSFGRGNNVRTTIRAGKGGLAEGYRGSARVTPMGEMNRCGRRGRLSFGDVLRLAGFYRTPRALTLIRTGPDVSCLKPRIDYRGNRFRRRPTSTSKPPRDDKPRDDDVGKLKHTEQRGHTRTRQSHDMLEYDHPLGASEPRNDVWLPVPPVKQSQFSTPGRSEPREMTLSLPLWGVRGPGQLARTESSLCTRFACNPKKRAVPFPPSSLVAAAVSEEISI